MLWFTNLRQTSRTTQFLLFEEVYLEDGYTVDSGMGIRCDKCDRYANMQHDDNFTEIEETEDCLINSEEQHYDKDTI